MDRAKKSKLRAGYEGRSLRIGVVGLGYWGPNLVRNLAEAAAFDLACLCDVRPKPLDALSRRYP